MLYVYQYTPKASIHPYEKHVDNASESGERLLTTGQMIKEIYNQMYSVLEKSAESKIQLTKEQQTQAHRVTRQASRAYLAVKRLFDFTAALGLSAVLLIPLLLIAIMIKLDSPGPVFFLQDRMGKDGKVFKIYKFRSMSIVAPRDVATRELTDYDSYVTRFGDFIRKTSLDELPQLINILRGEMSFVGYRPVCLAETELNQLRMEYGVFQALPGLTGYAQVSGRDHIDYVLKAELDAYYVQNRSLKMDLDCLIKTFKTVVTREGAM